MFTNAPDLDPPDLNDFPHETKNDLSEDGFPSHSRKRTLRKVSCRHFNKKRLSFGWSGAQSVLFDLNEAKELFSERLGMRQVFCSTFRRLEKWKK